MTDREMKLLCRVWTELNAICARDGAPVGVSEEYFESLKGQLGALIKRETGTGPHCHPLLYTKLEESVVLTHEEAVLLCNLLLGLETLGHQPESCRHWYELISGKLAEE